MKERTPMPLCETCGNDYEKTFEVYMNGRTYNFDCFECAIHALAPTCTRCGCTIIGHGVQSSDGSIFCCANCAREVGIPAVRA